MKYDVTTTPWQQYMEDLEGFFRVRENFDLLKKPLTVGGREARLYTIDGLTKDDLLQKLMQLWTGLKQTDLAQAPDATAFSSTYIPYAETEITEDPAQMAALLLSGAALLFLEPFREAMIIDARTYPVRSIDEPQDERVLRGSHDGFVETLIFNTAMLRRRIRDTRLTIEATSVGTRSKTDVAMAYLDGKADPKFVAKMRTRLKSLDIPSLTMGQQSLTEALSPKGWYNPFPKVRYTERPDSAAAAIAEGRVILLVDNSSAALILPVSIFDFLQENNDFCFPPLVGGYLRIVRFLMFTLTVYLTPLWYLLVSHPDMLPQWLQFIVPKEQAAIPILAQLYLFEFAIDALKLASLNTPSALSNSFSVISALILSDFAVQAGWFAPEVILYMGLSAIGSFVQPSYELAYAVKLLRLTVLALTGLFGLWGFWAGQGLFLFLLATVRTVSGGSYLYPLIPFHGKAMAGVLLRRTMNRRNS